VQAELCILCRCVYLCVQIGLSADIIAAATDAEAAAAVHMLQGMWF